VSALDVETTLDQFEAATRGLLTANSISTYRTGFRSGLARYLQWRAGDPNWDAGPSSRRARVAGKIVNEHTPPGGVTIVSHVFPIRPGLTMRLPLPIDLTEAEAERLTRFIRSLVV
jgi:hypothetical protein